MNGGMLYFAPAQWFAASLSLAALAGASAACGCRLPESAPTTAAALGDGPASGSAASAVDRQPSPSAHPTASPSAAAGNANGSAIGTLSVPSASAEQRGSPSAPDPQALLDVVEQLQTSGALDQRAKAELIENLKRSDPAIWPQLMEYFRASLAMRGAAHTSTHEEQHDRNDEPAVQSVAFRRTTSNSRRPVQAPAEKLVAAQRAASESDLLSTDSLSLDAGNHDPQGATVGMPNRAAPALLDQPAVAPQRTPSHDNAMLRSQPREANRPAKLRYAGDVIETSSAVDAEEPSESHPSASPSWREHLGSAIADLEEQLEQPHDGSDQEHVQAALRLMYLIDGRRDEALRPLPESAPAARDFWSKQLYGLGVYLNAQRTASAPRRATEALVHLREAADKLAELANLRLKNLTICTRVNGFGDYRRFEKYEFKAGQEIVLYGEVENFKSDASERGFRTALKCTVQILDRRGDRLADEKFPVSEEGRQNARHDFFLSCNFWLPKRLNPGTYTLQLSVEDELAQKTDQSSVELVVRD